MATNERIERASRLRAEQWPVEDLEAVKACPVCSNAERALLYDDLWDGSFLTAPGTWSLWRCAGCRSAYLDPRPTQASIGRAYEQYYTHAAAKTPHLKTGFARLKDMLGNGYRNRHYGTALHPSSSLGAVVAALIPATRRRMDHNFRFLPRLDGGNKRLLDVGCGAGYFLTVAREAGWECSGAEPDPAAAANATARGLDVRQGGIDAWHDSPTGFDAVTMSHVMEHVPDPRETVEAVFDLLKPGGQFYLETPNIDALSHGAFGRDWRGLETPRHLVLFTLESLTGLLKNSGFTEIRQRQIPSPLPFLIHESERMVALNGLGHRSAAGSDPLRIKEQAVGPKAEFLTLTCVRPE